MSRKSLKFILTISTMAIPLIFSGVVQAQSTEVVQGALAWDNWTKTGAGGSGSLPTGVTSGDYIRCKACHGWDRMGTDGGYVRRSRTASRANAGAGDGDTTSRALPATVTADMILHAGTGRTFAQGAGSWVALDGTHSAANKSAHAAGYTLGNQHPDFSGGDLTQAQVDNLVAFLNFEDGAASAYFSDINPDQNPVLYTIIETADAAAGESYYNSNCAGCHGDPASEGFVGSEGMLDYLQSDGKFSEFTQKVRWGIPNTSMTRASMGSPGSKDVADMMLYLQELGGTGFTINSGLSGNWWGGETRDGEGFLIDVARNLEDDTVVVASFYTYDSIGNQVWLIGAGTAVGNTAQFTLFVPEGAKWGDAFNPADRIETEWGTGTFSFTSCGSGHIALAPNVVMQGNGYTDLAYDINRDILIPAVTCPK